MQDEIKKAILPAIKGCGVQIKLLEDVITVMSLVWLKFWLVGWLRLQNYNRLELFLASDWLVMENSAQPVNHLNQLS